MRRARNARAGGPRRLTEPGAAPTRARLRRRAPGLAIVAGLAFLSLVFLAHRSAGPRVLGRWSVPAAALAALSVAATAAAARVAAGSDALYRRFFGPEPLLLTGSTLIALAACEGFARARAANSYRHYPPGTVRRMTTPEYDVEIAINRDGFRDRDHKRAKAPGTLRVAVIGDSFTWGSGVPADSAFPGRLEAILDSTLAARPHTGPDGRGSYAACEVMNFGVTWTGPVQYLRVWRGIASRYRPDVVVVAAYAGNDMADAYRESSRRRPKSALLSLVAGLLAKGPPDAGSQFGWNAPEAGNPAGLRALTAAGAARGLDEATIRARWEAVPETLRAEAAAFRINPYNLAEAVLDPESIVDNLLLSGGEARAGCAPAREALDALWRDARARGAAPLLAAIPAAVQVDSADWWVGRLGFRLDARLLGDAPVQDSLAACAGASGVPFLDLLPLFRARAGEVLYFEQDAHWNAAGHELAARALAERILSNAAR